MSPAYWRQPLKWNKVAEKAGERQRVFCSSMADVFEDHPTTAGELVKLWPLIRATPNLDWLLLTKCDERIAQSLPADWSVAAYPNVWLGVSVEDQSSTKRIVKLLEVEAARRFVSCEPLLGPVQIWLRTRNGASVNLGPVATGGGIDWVICGGESGPKAQPMHPDWVRGLRDQCFAAGCRFSLSSGREYKLE
jgi:protein gp37